MLYSTEVEELMAKCDELRTEVRKINPDHVHLQYSKPGMSEEVREDMALLFFTNFAPKGADLKNITNAVLILTWKSFEAALQTVVALENIKNGNFEPRK